MHAAAAEEGGQGPARLGASAVYELVKGLRGFEGIKSKDYEYVLEEAGFAPNKDVDFDEFVEVSGGGLDFEGERSYCRFCRSAPSFGRCCSRLHRQVRPRPRGCGYLSRRAVGVYKTHVRYRTCRAICCCGRTSLYLTPRSDIGLHGHRRHDSPLTHTGERGSHTQKQSRGYEIPFPSMFIQ